VRLKESPFGELLGDRHFWFLFGDYHVPVDIPPWQLFSIGSTHHHTFSDAGRGLGSVLIIDTEEGSYERVPIEAPRFLVVPLNKWSKETSGRDYYRVAVSSLEDAKRIVETAPDPSRIRFEHLRKTEEIVTRLEIQDPLNPKKVIDQYCKFVNEGRRAKEGYKYVDSIESG
jgi:hypothetical protein